MRVQAPPLREKAIIFNEWKRNELGPPERLRAHPPRIRTDVS